MKGVVMRESCMNINQNKKVVMVYGGQWTAK